MGRAATGGVTTVTGVCVHRVADCQIAETWISWEAYGLARQVGLFLLPGPSDGNWEGAPGPTRPGEPH